MDFKEIKKKALELKDEAAKKSKEALDYSAGKLAGSKFTIKSVEELEAFRDTSKSTQGKDSKTGEKKTYTHRSIVIFCETDTDFFTSMLYMLPVLEAKAFSQNVKCKLADVSMKGLHKAAYNVGEVPCLVVFENSKIIKTLEGEENIQKVVKSLSLDINKTIDEL